MSVDFHTTKISYTGASADLLHSFFSTISTRLESNGWGSRFPALLKELYQGKLPAKHIAAARQELAVVTKELADLPPDRVVWDIENREATPPWGDEISPDIKTLADYHVTSEGQRLVDVLRTALESATQQHSGVSLH